MKVVTMYKAAQIAGVSRQAIADLKKRNTLQVGKYPFFGFDTITGKYGVDVDSKAWETYLVRNKNKHRQETIPTRQAISKSNQGNSDDTGLIDRLLDSVEKTVVKIFKPTQKKKDDFFNELINNLPKMGK